MDAIAESQVFFFISSVGFVILGVLAAVLIVCLIRATDALYRLIEKIEKDIDKIGDTTKEMVEDMRDSIVFRFLFGKKKRSKNKN